MNHYKRGLVIDLNLEPTLGSETAKTRPCVIVSHDRYNVRTSIAQIVPITAWSSKKERIITNVRLYPNKQNGLVKPSIADCLQARAVDVKSRFVRERGMLTEMDMQKIGEALKIVFGFR